MKVKITWMFCKANKETFPWFSLKIHTSKDHGWNANPKTVNGKISMAINGYEHSLCLSWLQHLEVQNEEVWRVQQYSTLILPSLSIYDMGKPTIFLQYSECDIQIKQCRHCQPCPCNEVNHEAICGNCTPTFLLVGSWSL